MFYNTLERVILTEKFPSDYYGSSVNTITQEQLNAIRETSGKVFVYKSIFNSQIEYISTMPNGQHIIGSEAL